MILGRVRDGAGACFALRREADAGAGAATLFVTDWTPEGSRAAAFNLDDVTVELEDYHNVPGPRGPGGEWERVATALATAGGTLEAATAALVTRHKHGPNLVDVRLPPGTAALATVGVADALRWMREMYAESEAALEEATRPAEPPPPADEAAPEAAPVHRASSKRPKGEGTALMSDDDLAAKASCPPALAKANTER